VSSFLDHDMHEKHEIVFVGVVVAFMFGQAWMQWTSGGSGLAEQQDRFGG
jgi:hypothetical protein